MRCRTATEVFDKVNFDNYVDYRTYPTADYECQKCSQTISINYANLEKHALSEFSKLSSVDRGKVQVYLIDSNRGSNSFLDFYCPKCKGVVSVHYHAWAGGRHGQAGYKLEFVIDEEQ